MTVIEPIINCPLNPSPDENRTPLESCVKYCPNFVKFNENMQVVCTVGRKVK